MSALLEDAAGQVKPREGAVSTMQDELKLSDIRPNPRQPRTEFDEEALRELAASIKSIGVVQPITVREAGEGKYEIVAGERRFRAARLAGLETIPAYLKKVGDDSVLEMAELLLRNQVSPATLDQYLESHLIGVSACRGDSFDAYFIRRAAALLDRIEAAAGKPIAGRDSEPVVQAFGGPLL